MSSDENTPDNLRYDLDKLREDVERMAKDVQSLLKQNEQHHKALSLISEAVSHLRTNLTLQRAIPNERAQQDTLNKFAHAADQTGQLLRSMSDS